MKLRRCGVGGFANFFFAIFPFLMFTIIFLIASNQQEKMYTNTETVVGTFPFVVEATDNNGNEQTLYQFRSNDNDVWWQLTAEEIGFVPNANQEYVLTYDNNGTTKANKTCDCEQCECEVYDDILLSVKEKGVKCK